MQAKLLCSGNDGFRHYKRDDVYDGDGDWIRSVLASGLAEPLDEKARSFIENPAMISRYARASMQGIATERRINTGDTASVVIEDSIKKG